MAYCTYMPWPQTATGSRMFPFLASFCSSQKTGKALVGRLCLDITNVMASKRSKKEKSWLPVAIRGSWMSVLKLPIVLSCCWYCNLFLIHYLEIPQIWSSGAGSLGWPWLWNEQWGKGLIKWILYNLSSSIYLVILINIFQHVSRNEW